MRLIEVPGQLKQRRQLTDKEWSRFISGNPIADKASTPSDIALSWQRCASSLSPYCDHVPADDEQTAGDRWQQSPLRLAAKQERETIKQLAREGSLVAAIADPRGRLMWTFASRHMRDRSESVNFIAGGRWDESSAGTNAVGLAATLRRSTTVFSSEHYLSSVHDWVCYAAPIVHPQTGTMLGVLDISTTWDHHTPLGQAAVSDLARSIARRLPAVMPRSELEIHALGQPRIVFRGKEQRVSHRQLEILCLLALNPQGLTLDAFHAALYGDTPVSTSTLKAELSHLRRMLDGQIGSRPYRLTIPIWADFIDLWQSLRYNQIDEAFSLYRGIFMPQSSSPELEEWRNCIEAVMSKVLGSCNDSSVLMKKMCEGSAGSELVRERLAELMAQSR